MTRTAKLIAAGFLIALAGCAADKLSKEVPFTLPNGEETGKIIILPAQSVDQTLTINVTSDNAVDVFVLTGTNASGADTMSPKEWASKAVASKTGITKESFTAKIPAKGETKIIVTPGAKSMKASGTIKVTN